MRLLKEKTLRLLRWSELYTKTDMVHLVSSGGWLSGGYLVSSIVAFLMAIAFANFVEKETYGTYRFILSLGIIFGAFSLTGLKTSVTRSVASGFEGTLQSAFKERMIWSIPMFLIAGGASIYYLILGNMVIAASLVIVALCNPILYSSTLYAAYLNGKEAYRTNALYAAIRAVVPAIIMLIVIRVVPSVPAMVIAYFAAHTILAFLFYTITARTVPSGAPQDTASNAFGKHLSITNLIDIAANQLDKVLVFHFVGASDLAVYYFALNIPEQINGLFSNIYSIALPKFSRRPINELRKTLFSKVAQFGLIMLIIVTTYIISAPLIYKVIFPNYIEAIRLSQIAALGMIGVIGTLPTALLHAKQATRLIYTSRTISSLIRIGLLIALVIPYGVLGVVLASVLNKIIDAIVASLAVGYIVESEK